MTGPVFTTAETPVIQVTFVTSSQTNVYQLFIIIWKKHQNEHANFASKLGKFIQRDAISINLCKRIIKMQIINTFYGNVPAEFCQIKWLRIYKYICSTFFSYVLRIGCFIFSTSVPAITLHLSAVHRSASVMPRRSDRAHDNHFKALIKRHYTNHISIYMICEQTLPRSTPTVSLV